MGELKICRNSIYRTYSNMIDDIEDDEIRDKLHDDLEAIDELILCLECNIEEEIDAQEADYGPSLEEQRHDAQIAMEKDFFAYNRR